MPKWVVEEGIGETRALLIDGERVLAAKLRWPGEFFAGEEIDARLVRKSGTRGTAALTDGREILVDKLPRDASEGAVLRLVVTRAAMAERGRLKLPAARPAKSAGQNEQDVFREARSVRHFPIGTWEEIWDAASSAQVDFAGGSLLFSVTPAMTLIDIDGDLPPRELALAAVPHIARWLVRFDLGGSIGIDFPTLQAKDDRKAVDRALEEALDDWSHERTAMNGFGFVQIVARLDGPSLLHRFATSRVSASARMALRRAELVQGPGATLMTIHPALKAKLRPEWLEELARRTGREVRIAIGPDLAIEAAAAQIIPHDE